MSLTVFVVFLACGVVGSAAQGNVEMVDMKTTRDVDLGYLSAFG